MTRATYHISAEGMKIYRDGELIKHILPSQFAHIILEMAKVLNAQMERK